MKLLIKLEALLREATPEDIQEACERAKTVQQELEKKEREKTNEKPSWNN